MARSELYGDVVGVDEISRSLIDLRQPGRSMTWGIILVTTALGVYAASFLGGGEPLALTSVIIGALGFGLLLANWLSTRSNATESGASTDQIVS